MGRNDTTAAMVDSLLKLALSGAVLTATLVAPNALSALGKPLKKQFDRLDEKSRERELRRVVSYMKSQGLLTGSYQHGLQITARGRQRLSRLQFETINISQPQRWDHTWRIVFYDIPEENRAARRALTAKLHELGFLQLQRSVLVHPFPCREVIEKITETYSISRYVSYIETPRIDNERHLIKRFEKHASNVNFK